MIQQLSQSDFKLQSLDTKSPKLRNSKGYSVLLIKAEWCGFCHRYLPEFESQSQKYKKVNFVYIEQTDEERLLNQWAELANPAYAINGFPTVVLYDKKGDPLKIIDRNMLSEELNKLL